MSVLIVTSVGDIVVDLHADRCPLTAKNFLKLCKMKYYNGCLFHKVEKDFMAQTGDRTGTGTAGDSLYKFLFGDQARFFEDEIHPDLKHSKKGTVAMASAGENCNASQFYFTLRDDIDYLDGKHTVFGIVEEKEGLDTLEKINETFVDDKGRPFKNIRIKHTYILDDPFDDPSQLAEFIPENSPEGKPHDEIAEERLEDNWAPMDTTLNPQEYIEVIHAKEAHTNAAILESIGDIPDADIKPPENVLFVCKLNPVTQDEDLHTIFSRFGTVSAADIIRDFKTGDSLCYAFIEFENREACEMAYFKMDNTLIDDRRIHVDFSQSVSKLWKKFRHGTRTHTNTGGCFKCGAEDHIAKDCDPAANNKERGPRYVLKQENIQHGNDRRMYDMMFDEENLENMEQQGKAKKRKMDSEKSEHSKHKDYDRKDSEKSEHSKHTDYDRKYSEKSEHSRHKDYDRKDSDKRRDNVDRTEGNKEDRNRDGKRDDSYLNEERHAKRYKDREHQNRHGDRDHRNRHDDRDHRNRYEEREHEKRHERSSSRHDDDDGDQRDSRKRNGDSDRGRKEDVSYRSRGRDSPRRERRHK